MDAPTYVCACAHIHAHIKIKLFITYMYLLISSNNWVRSLGVFMAMDSTAPYSECYQTHCHSHDVIITQQHTCIYILHNYIHIHSHALAYIVHVQTWKTRKLRALIKIPIDSSLAWYWLLLTTWGETHMYHLYPNTHTYSETSLNGHLLMVDNLFITDISSSTISNYQY